eukprot:scaffold33315_cov48-Tisochrysis_lutea.AAC.1
MLQPAFVLQPPQRCSPLNAAAAFMSQPPQCRKPLNAAASFMLQRGKGADERWEQLASILFSHANWGAQR